MDAMDLVRAFYRALNESDADAMAALYDPDCVVEHVWADGRDVVEGRERACEHWRAEFARYSGALAGGHRVDVTRIAGIETGWGWVRSEWVRAIRDNAFASGVDRFAAGYSHFWVERG